MLSIPEITKACAGRVIGHEHRALSGVSTDTRTIKPGSLFFALRGKNYDGHQFLSDAFHKGAAAAVVDERFAKSETLGPHTWIIVQDVYRALLDAARAYRQKFRIPIVAVTGSAGKTTTKECIRAILSLHHETLSNVGNFNNHIGLPLSVFEMNQATRAAVFELGASQPGDIRELCKVTEPAVGVLTCVQPVHLESFGSIDTIYRTKLELAEWIAGTQGDLVISGDDAELVRRAKKISPKLKTFGRGRLCDFRISDERQDGEWIRFMINEKFSFSIKAFGLFNVLNFAAGIAASDALQFDLAEIAQNWHSYHPVSNRFEIECLEHPRITIVKDFYNSNPVSFALSLQAFEALPSKGRKIVVAGDMLELGPEALKYHTELGERIGKSRANAFVYIGKHGEVAATAACKANHQIQAATFSDNQRASEYLSGFLRDYDHVFMKASRGMKFEEIINLLKKNPNLSLTH